MTKFKVCSRTLVIVLLTASSAFADGAVAQMTGGVHEKNLQPDNMELHLTGVKQSEDTVDIVGSDGVVGLDGGQTLYGYLRCFRQFGRRGC